MKLKTSLLCVASLFLILLSNWSIAQMTVPFTFQNNSSYPDTSLYVAIVGQNLTAGAYVWVDGKTGVQNPMSPSYNTIQGPVYSGNEGPGNNAMYASCFTKLSDIPNKTIQVAGIQGCRIYISVKSQLYFYFFGSTGSPSGYTSPSYTDPTDPNTGILYETIELTNNQYGLWENTTRVDAYNYSMGLELTDSNNVIQKTGELKNHSDIGTLFQASVPIEFQGCYNPTTGTIIFPTKTQEFSDGSIGTMPTVGSYVNYMQPYIDSVWAKYANEDLIFNASDGSIWKGRVENDSLVMTCQSGGYVGQKGIIARPPTTQEAFEGKGILNNVVQDATTDLLVEAQICAALTRHVINTTTPNVGQQDWSNPSTYYQKAPCNYYAKFWHQQGISLNQLSYGFAYDDVFNQSSTLQSPIPKSTLVIFGGFADSAAAAVESPYGGTPWPIPGIIQAENYDLGGQGVAYNDSDPTNDGGQYRLTEGVDIEATTDTGGGYDVGWTVAGEWMQYTVNVREAGIYTLQARVASILTGETFYITMDGVNISGILTVPNTGGYQNWQTISVTTPLLTTGLHIMRIVETTGGYNLNYFTFSVSTLDACSNASDYLIATSSTTGNTYQWQLVNNSEIYEDINNGVVYGGVNTDTLTFNNIPTSMYGSLFRCAIANGGITTYSPVYTLKFVQTWMGTVSNAWETAGNWSCGVVPDSNTDVIINSGTPVINSTVNIRSLELNPAAQLTVSLGKQLNILH